MNLKNPRFWPWLLLLCVVGYAYFAHLGEVPLLGRDEPRYAQIGREMWQRGDWVTPTLGGHLWFEKPILLYWGLIVSYSIFGVSEWAARFFPAVLGLTCCGLVGWVATRVERRTDWRGYGLAAAFVTASCAGLMVFARGATFDIVLTAPLCAALCCYLAAEIEENLRQKSQFLVGFWVSIGLALLAKGLVGMLLPALVVGFYAVVRREGRAFWKCGLWWGIPLALLVAATWYGPMFLKNGPLFWHEFFVRHQFERYTSNEFRHQQAWWFYGPILMLFCLPWTPFLLAQFALARSWNWRGASAEDKTRTWAFCWMVVPVAFFSISGSKLPSYILPALPGAALFMAELVARVAREAKRSVVLGAGGALLLILGAAILILVPKKLDLSTAWALWIAFPFLVAGLLGVWASAPDRLRFRSASIAALGAPILLVVALMPDFAIQRAVEKSSARDLLLRAARDGYGAAPVYQRGGVERTAEFYAVNRIVYGPNGEPVQLNSLAQLKAALAKTPKMLIFLPLDDTARLEHSLGHPPDFSANNGKIALVGIGGESD